MSISDLYSITESLSNQASGRFGKLYKGVSKRNGDPVLIKALSKNQVDNSAVERLRNEAQFSFSSERLPVILDYYESETESILVRNFVKGTTLDRHWEQLRRKEKKDFLLHLIHEMEQIFDALGDKNVVHCDLRPGNLIVDDSPERRIHLIDFGLAIDRGEPEKRKMIFPLGYAAPELLLNFLELVDGRTDQYALGIIIWRLYAGTLPLVHPNPSIFTNLQLTHAIPDHSALPKGVYPILQKMTKKYQFQIPPNQMNKEDVSNLLTNAIEGRYAEFSEIKAAFSGLPKKCFYQKRSFR